MKPLFYHYPLIRLSTISNVGDTTVNGSIVVQKEDACVVTALHIVGAIDALVV